MEARRCCALSSESDMNRKKWHCPECDSDNIYYTIGAALGAPITGDANLLQIAKGSFTEAPLDVYVCGDCGAVRTFVSERDALQKISEMRPRINE